MKLDAKSLYYRNMVDNMKMTFDSTLPVQTRDGRKARIICTDMKGEGPILALLDSGPYEIAKVYLEDGKLEGSGTDPCSYDLINIPEKRWALIWKTEGEYGVTVIADEIIVEELKRRTGGVIACLEFTEGDGLDE